MGNLNTPKLSYKFEKERNKVLLTIADDDSAELLSDGIKDYLLFHGFNRDYDVNRIGVICENLIDKFHKIGW